MDVDGRSIMIQYMIYNDIYIYIMIYIYIYIMVYSDMYMHTDNHHISKTVMIYV